MDESVVDDLRWVASFRSVTHGMQNDKDRAFRMSLLDFVPLAGPNVVADLGRLEHWSRNQMVPPTECLQVFTRLTALRGKLAVDDLIAKAAPIVGFIAGDA